MSALTKTFIKKIFSSIQGEGLFVGQKHIFVRFCKCNLTCKYCDTNFTNNKKEYSTEDLYQKLQKYNDEIISFTGGEPLLDIEFLFNFLNNYKNKLNKKIYLETNGTLPNELKKIINLVDIVAMDIKLESCTRQKNKFEINKQFLEIAKEKEYFIKVVFDNNISNDEISNIVNMAEKYNSLIVLQPKMPLEKNIMLEEIFNKFFNQHKNIRLIPQTHKFLNLA